MARLQRTYLSFEGKQIPAKIYKENRKNVRASIGKRTVILRMPIFVNGEEEQKHLHWFNAWVQKQFAKDTSLHVRFFGKGYNDGDLIQVGDRQYHLNIRFTDRKTHQAKLSNGIITLWLSKTDTEAHLQKAIKHLISRVVGQDYKPYIVRRVNELNNLYFQKSIKSVNLKYNHTNWGSCSSEGNVNLSTRLLFAPEAVVDYVIIHELAHLIELNHSERFWKLVEDAMPEYKRAEKWLSKNGALCQF